MIVAPLLAAAIVVGAPAHGAGQTPQTTAEVARSVVLERCPALMQADADISEAIATTAGLEAYVAYTAADRACGLSLQADVEPSLTALRRALSAGGGSEAGPDVWRLGDDLVVIQTYAEDGVPGAEIVRARANGPLGERVIARLQRRARSAATVATHAVLDLCPPLIADDAEAALQSLLRAEPELVYGALASDPDDATVTIGPLGQLCYVGISGPTAETVVVAVMRAAEARGYVEDATGRFRLGDQVLWANRGEGEQADQFALILAPAAVLDQALAAPTP